MVQTMEDTAPLTNICINCRSTRVVYQSLWVGSETLRFHTLFCELECFGIRVTRWGILAHDRRGHEFTAEPLCSSCPVRRDGLNS